MKHIIAVGLGFGDEGKGSIVDALVRRTSAKLVVRFNGGAQAAHHVVIDGNSFCHSQTSAGSFAGAATYLGPHVKVDLPALSTEIAALRRYGVRPQVWVDWEAPLLTPWHKAVNRLRELSRPTRHGSCGIGIGELSEDIAELRTVVRVGDIGQTWFFEKLRTVQLTKRLQAQQLLAHTPVSDNAARWLGLLDASVETVQNLIERSTGYLIARYGLKGVLTNFTTAARDPVVYEGAQGVLLDETHGFHPHTTWSDCTFAHALSLAREADAAPDITKIGVLRAFMTRHGAGPLPTEINDDLATSYGWTAGESNFGGPWQGRMRYGHFDAVLARYALEVVGGVDQLALTCLDRLDDGQRIAASYRGYDAVPHLALGQPKLAQQQARGEWLKSVIPTYVQHIDPAQFIPAVELALGRDIDIRSYGPTASDKQWTSANTTNDTAAWTGAGQ